MISIIVSVDDNWLMGRTDGKMPWHVPEDLKWFKQATMWSSIIMGRKTWESLPNKPLPGRYNIVVSRSLPPQEFEDHAFVPSIELALGLGWVKSKNWPASYDPIFVIGGAEIYKYVLEKHMVGEILVSRIKGKYEGDIYFPKIDENEFSSMPFLRFDKFEVIKYIKF
jgi:dihydrofolate reductase